MIWLFVFWQLPLRKKRKNIFAYLSAGSRGLSNGWCGTCRTNQRRGWEINFGIFRTFHPSYLVACLVDRGARDINNKKKQFLQRKWQVKKNGDWLSKHRNPKSKSLILAYSVPSRLNNCSYQCVFKTKLNFHQMKA